MLCLKLNFRHFDDAGLSGVLSGVYHRKGHPIMKRAGIIAVDRALLSDVGSRAGPIEDGQRNNELWQHLGVLPGAGWSRRYLPA
jgi:hypothetical protein